ncbi:olfactory receptor 52E4-like [Rana temporaria]|uniref:olfactory receptor 52E4-like n=1 Tax=Rana temporaria TaxID=8407 RepID=UPI001AAE183E|nr:olfactory receptor 52E4-like [Rana temporaria]
MWNSTSFHPDYFLLIGIPVLEDSHLLISIPFSIMYVLALLGNSTLILVISTNEILHQPMYIFLMMLAFCDTLLSSSTVPKTLSIFWFDSHEISFNGCLIEVFFIHFTFGIESSILLLMAYDRYCAICHPLTYATTLTNSFIAKATTLAVFRVFSMAVPFVFLLKRLPFKQSNVIEHTYCEHMSVAKLATADILINTVYGLMTIFTSPGADMILIVLSYAAIISAVLRLPSSEDRFKAFNTCVSHICVIVLFYIPAFFSFIAHRVGHKYISLQFHIIFANLYVLIPPMMNPIIYGVRMKEIRERTLVIFSRLTGNRQ